MAELGKTYEFVCSEDGKENLNQPYMWLGVEDAEGDGIWKRSGDGRVIAYANWDDNEGSEGDTCARMLGNGNYGGFFSVTVVTLFKSLLRIHTEKGFGCRKMEGHGVQEVGEALRLLPHARPAASLYA